MSGHASIADQRDQAAQAIDRAVDQMQRAAVNLDTAITHARAADLPVDGCVTTLRAMIDTLRDQIDFGRRDHRWLTDLADEARRRAETPGVEAA